MPFAGELPQLSTADNEAHRNGQTLLRLVAGYWMTQTVRAAAELQIADHVGAGMTTAREVADAEGSDPKATYRLMRACASLGLLSVDREGRFSLTGMGQLLRQDAPHSLRGAALLHGAPGQWQPWGLLTESVREGCSQVRSALGESLGEYLAANPTEAGLLSRTTSDQSRLLVEDVVRLLDLGDAATVVDVGGADGSLVLGLMLAHPHLRGRVLDLPQVVDAAATAASVAGLADRFCVVGGDFFDSVPAADYYLLKWILNGWDDEDCVRILRTCRKAANPGARALVVEMTTDAGELCALADMNMLAVLQGQGRELAELDVFFGMSGWRRVAMRSTRTPYSLIELEAV
jgi:hypothetical protein